PPTTTSFYYILTRPSTISYLFSYTTLFRSGLLTFLRRNKSCHSRLLRFYLSCRRSLGSFLLIFLLERLLASVYTGRTYNQLRVFRLRYHQLEHRCRVRYGCIIRSCNFGKSA